MAYKKYLKLVNWCAWTATESDSSAMNARRDASVKKA